MVKYSLEGCRIERAYARGIYAKLRIISNIEQLILANRWHQAKVPRIEMLTAV